MLNWQRWGVVIPSYGGTEHWRANRVANPDILQTPDGKWRMYYNGGNSHHRVAGRYGYNTIGLATLSLEGGLPVWRDYRRNPVLPIREGAPMEAAIDPAVVYWRGCYFMVTSSWAAGATCFIGLSVSNDGLAFEQVGHIFPGRAPELVVCGNDLYLFYVMDEEDTYRIHLAVAKGSFHKFEEHPESPVFEAVPGTWEGQSVTTPRIYFERGWYYMIYCGDPDDRDYPPYFGIARSRDLVHWQRSPHNPIFERGPLGAPDEGAIWWGELFRWGWGYILYYEGYAKGPNREKYGGGVSQICAAYTELPVLAGLF